MLNPADLYTGGGDGRTASVLVHALTGSIDAGHAGRLVTDHLLGRVNSVYRFFGWGTSAIGTVLGGALVNLGEPFVGREWALRGVFLLAGVAHLGLIAFAASRVGTDQIRAAEAAAAESLS